jgi:tetratricopeptide (TPR) repeat protein
VTRILVILALLASNAVADPPKSKADQLKDLRAQIDGDLKKKDLKAAEEDYATFLALDPGNAKVWIEFADTLMAARKFDSALAAYASAEKLLASDVTVQIEVIARRGQAFEALDKLPEALAEYDRAIVKAPKGYYLEVELTDRIVGIYRRRQSLPVLLAKFEAKWPAARRRFFEWNTLGKLYEETGASDKAIVAFQKAVAMSPFELDAQRRLIQMLENAGRDADAFAQLKVVVKVAPGEARFQLELAERLFRNGRTAEALAVLAKMEDRFKSFASVLSAVADLYSRWGKPDLAARAYEAASKVPPDPVR